jgi:hypothetical protein
MGRPILGFARYMFLSVTKVLRNGSADGANFEELTMEHSFVNSLSGQVPTATSVMANITEAKAHYRNSKDSAGKAAAYAYLVWRDCLSNQMSRESNAWLVEQVVAGNDKIGLWNNEEETLRKRVEAFKKKRLAEVNKDDLALQTSEVPEDMALIKKEQDRLKSFFEFKVKDWEARKKVPIEGRGAWMEFAVVVKFVFEFDDPADSSVASRYTQVLAWLADKLKGKTVHDVSEIVAEIDAVGGFERALHDQRGKPVQKAL